MTLKKKRKQQEQQAMAICVFIIEIGFNDSKKEEKTASLHKSSQCHMILADSMTLKKKRKQQAQKIEVVCKKQLGAKIFRDRVSFKIAILTRMLG